MRLILDMTQVTCTVTKNAEPRRDYGKTEQRTDKSGRPQWVLEVLAQDAERGEVIRVTVTGDQPRMTVGQHVRFDALEAVPWSNNGKAGVAYRADAVHAAPGAKAA